MVWQPGQSGNPTGKGATGRKKSKIRRAFEASLKKAEQETGKQLFKELVLEAINDPAGATARDVLRKILPDLKSIEADITSKDGITIIIKGKELKKPVEATSDGVTVTTPQSLKDKSNGY